MELDLALKDYWDGNFSCGVHDQVTLISNHRHMITRVNKAKDGGWVISQSSIDNAEELLAQWTANTKIVGHDYSKGILDHQQMVAHARSGLI